jgi:nicotinamidase-related amidase
MKYITSLLFIFICSTFNYIFPQQIPSQKEKPALLVIDIQNGYLPIMDAAEMKQVIKAIPSVIKLFHARGLPVIRVYHTDPEHGPRPGEKGFEFPGDIPSEASDIKVTKTRPSAFEKTELENILRKAGCNTLYLCGLSMTGCVYATYQEADHLALNPFIIDKFVTSHSAPKTKEFQSRCRTITYAEIEKRLHDATQ